MQAANPSLADLLDAWSKSKADRAVEDHNPPTIEPVSPAPSKSRKSRWSVGSVLGCVPTAVWIVLLCIPCGVFAAILVVRLQGAVLPGPFDQLADHVCVLAAAVDSPDRATEALAIADAIDSIVDRIDRGDLDSIGSVFGALRPAARDALSDDVVADWADWNGSLALLLGGCHRDGDMVTPRDAAGALTEVSRGLRMSAERS